MRIYLAKRLQVNVELEEEEEYVLSASQIAVEGDDSRPKRIGWDQIDQRLLLPSKHGKPTVKAAHQVPSPHYRACKRWKDLHLAESLRHYGQSIYSPENGQHV